MTAEQRKHASGDTLLALGKAARDAARILSLASTDQKNTALHAMAKAIRADAKLIATENAADLGAAKSKDLKSSFIDRLTLNAQRIEAMAQGLDDIAALPDPVGRVGESWTRPNGLK